MRRRPRAKRSSKTVSPKVRYGLQRLKKKSSARCQSFPKTNLYIFVVWRFFLKHVDIELVDSYCQKESVTPLSQVFGRLLSAPPPFSIAPVTLIRNFV